MTWIQFLNYTFQVTRIIINFMYHIIRVVSFVVNFLIDISFDEFLGIGRAAFVEFMTVVSRVGLCWLTNLNTAQQSSNKKNTYTYGIRKVKCYK